jgi:DNA primase
VFDKSRALYGIDRAKDGIRTLNASVLVEGQIDLLMAHQAGYKNAVATSGTACTLSHAELLKRYSDNLLICYDGDRAGIAAAGRAAALALPIGMNVKIATLPPGKDPADVIRESVSIFKDAVKGALHVVDFYLAHIADAKYDARTYRLEVSRTVLPYIAMLPNKIDQAHFVKRVAESLGVAEDAVLSEVKKVDTKAAVPHGHVEALSPVKAAEPFLSRGDALERLVFGLTLALTESGDSASAKESIDILTEAVGEERCNALSQGQTDDKRAALFEADIFLGSYEDEEEKAKAIKELYADLMKESYHERYRETLMSLRMAEAAKDSKRTDELMQDLNRLASKLR